VIGFLLVVLHPPVLADAAPNSNQPTPGAAPGGKPPAQFDIWEIDVDGNTVLDDAVIEQNVKPFLGPGRSFADVDYARGSLEAAYHERGYNTVSVSIPRQTVHDGIVLLSVNEGRVGHLNVVGSKYHSLDEIKEEAPSLQEGGVPNFRQVQKDVVTLNRQQDRRVTPSLKAGAAPGTVDVDLVVEDHVPLHGTVELNNRRSEDTTELRSSASLSYSNLWQEGHSLSLSYQVAPERPSDANVLYGSYLARFGSAPLSILFSALNSNSNVATVGGTDVVGKGRSFGIRGIYELPAGRYEYPTVSFGVDYKRFKTVTTLGNSSFETPVEYYPFSIGYNNSIRGDESLLQADVSLVFASPRLGSDTQTIQLNRAYARGNTLYLRENLSVTSDLWRDVQGFVRLSGQLADQPLISNEQFAVGGMDTVRGYLEAEALGDVGYGGTLELRSPSLGDYISFGSVHPVQDLRFLSFFDGTALVIRNALPGQASTNRLMSLGAGFNMRFFNYVNGAFVWADPLINQSATKAWSSRLLFRVWTSF
jgi:hemolysin activation/secretion protein